MKRVYALIVNWNGWADTLECLESLLRVEDVFLRVMVCDNGSVDASLDKIRAWANGNLDVCVSLNSPLRQLFQPPVTKPVSWFEYDRSQAERGGNTDIDPQLILIRTGANLGFAGGNNVGFRYALARDDFDYIWVLNNDTVVAPASVSKLVDRMVAKPTAGMCGSTLLRYYDPGKIEACGGGYYCKWLGLPWHIGRMCTAADISDSGHAERWMNYVVGASMLISRPFLKDIGLMSEEYFLYFEETDWAIRAKGTYSIAYAPESIVYHKVGASIGTSTDPRKKSLICDYYNIRNRIYFTRKFYPYALVTVYFVLLFAILVRLICGQWRRAVMITRLMLNFGSDETGCLLKSCQ